MPSASTTSGTPSLWLAMGPLPPPPPWPPLPLPPLPPSVRARASSTRRGMASAWRAACWKWRGAVLVPSCLSVSSARRGTAKPRALCWRITSTSASVSASTSRPHSRGPTCGSATTLSRSWIAGHSPWSSWACSGSDACVASVFSTAALSSARQPSDETARSGGCSQRSVISAFSSSSASSRLTWTLLQESPQLLAISRASSSHASRAAGPCLRGISLETTSPCWREAASQTAISSSDRPHVPTGVRRACEVQSSALRVAASQNEHIRTVNSVGSESSSLRLARQSEMAASS